MKEKEASVERICRLCDYHISGAIAGRYVRWVECKRCVIDPEWHLSWWQWIITKIRKRHKARSQPPENSFTYRQGA